MHVEVETTSRGGREGFMREETLVGGKKNGARRSS